jgi:hypothetical protein
MAYASGQPWDASLSYSKLQDCYYKGLHYLYWHPTENSTIGVPPNEEMKMFKANNGSGVFEERSDRAWVLWFYSPNSVYEVKKLQPTIRGTGVQNENATDSLLYDLGVSFAFQNFLKPFGTEQSWSYYQDPVVEPLNLGVSTDYGVAIPSFDIPATEGDWNVSSQDYRFAVPFPFGGTLDNIYYPKLSYYVEEPNVVFEVSFPIDEYKTILDNGNTAYAVGVMNNFDRTVSYTLHVTETDNTVIPPVVTNTTINDSINSGPFRDNWTNTAPKKLYPYPIVTGHSVSMTITLNSRNPRFWV